MTEGMYDAYLQSHREQHLEELKSFLRFPSISTDPSHRGDVTECAEHLAKLARQAGFEHVELWPTKGHPVVYGDWLHANDAPTVVVYGHYDVQPADPLELWETPPFDPQVRDGQLFARGASDDKGPTFMHLKAFEALFATDGRLPVNVKLFLEGEEEIGSAHLTECLETHLDRLQGDLLVISDTTMLGPDQPSICYGLRGLAALQVDVRGANRDLHSGLYGGAAPNAVHALVELLATLHDTDGRVTVPGFYDDVDTLTEEEQAAYQDLHFDEAALMREIGVTELVGEPGYPAIARLWTRPTLELNGIYGGFQGEGTKTVIPASAHAKITCRLVPHQTGRGIQQLVAEHLQANAPKGIEVSVQLADTGEPYVTPFDHPAIQLAADAYTHAYGKRAVFTRMGGSIPIVETFERMLHVPVVLMGFGLNTENFHAPNEHFALANFDRGLRTLCYYWQHLPAALSGANA